MRTYLLLALLSFTTSAMAATKVKCTDNYHAYYLLDLSVQSCSGAECSMRVFQHDSPSACDEFDREFPVSLYSADGILTFKSDVLELKVNTLKAPNSRLLQRFGRPFGHRKLARGQLRVFGEIAYPTPFMCNSILRSKYSSLVCTVQK